MIARYTILFLSICFARAAHAQIPNPGFENWTVVGLDYEYPTGWYNLNPVTFASNVYTCQRGVSGPEGSFFVRVTTRSFNGTTLPGLISASANNSADAGFPFTTRPASLTGKRLYQVAAPDQASITVQLTRWNTTTQETETIGTGVLTATGTVATWQDFSIPIMYASPDTPDSARIIILSSGGVPAVNSTISVDALAFGGSVGVPEQEQATFHVFPSPATDVLNIRSELAVQNVQVLDARGRVIPLPTTIADGIVNVSALPAGCYLLEVRFANGARSTRTFYKI